MGKIFIFFITLFVCFSFTGDEKKWKEIKKINVSADFITTDRLGNLYLVDKNFIHLYNSNGDSITSFNSRRFGEISAVDATDPYKILVFFSDYNLIIHLDNYLSLNGEELDLQARDFDQVSLACQSRTVGVWIFDQLRQKAIHLNENFEADKETVNLYQWFGKRITPNFMFEYNNQLYIVEKESGIYLFDHFGTLKKVIPITGIESIQMNDGNISFFKDGKYCMYLERDFQENCEPTPSLKAKNVRIEKNRIYLFNPKSTSIFSTN